MAIIRTALSPSARYVAQGRLCAALLILALVLAACDRSQTRVNTGTATTVMTTVPSRVASLPPGTPTVTVSPPASTRAAATASLAAPAGPIPGLAEALGDVTAISLEDNWDGLSLTRPIEARFSLRPEREGYTGVARFSVGRNTSRSAEARCTILLPSDAARPFLTLLATTQGRAGPYIPRESHIPTAIQVFVLS